MKKKLLIGLGIIGALVITGGIGAYLYIKSLMPVPEERLNFLSDRVITSIDKQLADVDVTSLKEKEPFIYQKSLAEIQSNLASHKINHEDLVAYYLLRIKNLDQSEYGNNSISEINPTAMEEARRFDEMSEKSGILAGIPVLLKENINTDDMPTSAGSFALRDFVPKENAPAVTKLKEQGAIILGKANLSEMSYWMHQNNPSGYSSKKGQTLNPFAQLEISALGSSTGSAVAMATDLATVSLGTETVGSTIAPASVNSVVGFKPTRGHISGEGVIPITQSLDTVGSITKTVEDAYVTYQAASDKDTSITFSEDYLKGKRIGLFTDSSSQAFEKDITSVLTKAGAKVEKIDLDTDGLDASFILTNDFEDDLNHYLTTYQAPVKSLKELIAYNKENKEERMRYGQSHLEESLAFKDKDNKKVATIIEKAKKRLTTLLSEKDLDAIVFKDNDGVTMTALAGAPEVSVPFGIQDKTPVGATFVTDVNQDEEALKLAYSFEQLTKKRQIPKGY